MAFFKTKAEKEIMAQMQRDEQMQIFNDQINELKAKRQEYAHIAAEAEVNGDQGSYDVALSALMELNDVISSLTQTKANLNLSVQSMLSSSNQFPNALLMLLSMILLHQHLRL